MKTRFLFLSGLLALTGCGGNSGPNMSDITPGDETTQSDFERVFTFVDIFKDKNYHIDATYLQYGLPDEESVTSYVKSFDCDRGKIKAEFSRGGEPYYFDFTKTGETSPFTVDVYTPLPPTETEPLPYEKKSKSVTVSNDFMDISKVTNITDGRTIPLASGLSFSQFNYNGGIYSLNEPVVIVQPATEFIPIKFTYTFDVFKISFCEDHPKEVYYHQSILAESEEEEQTMTMSSEAKLVFSKYEQVSVTLPTVEE